MCGNYPNCNVEVVALARNETGRRDRRAGGRGRAIRRGAFEWRSAYIAEVLHLHGGPERIAEGPSVSISPPNIGAHSIFVVEVDLKIGSGSRNVLGERGPAGGRRDHAGRRVPETRRRLDRDYRDQQVSESGPRWSVIYYRNSASGISRVS